MPEVLTWVRGVLAAGIVAAAAFAVPVQAIEGPYAETFEAEKLNLDNLVGVLTIEIGGKDMSVEIEGREDELEYISVSVEGDELFIHSSKTRRNIRGPLKDIAEFRLRIPRKTPLTGTALMGRLSVGDLDGPISLRGTALRGRIGDVTRADVRISGSGELTFSDIQGALTADVDGSGDIIADFVGSAEVDIAGSGDARIKSIANGFDADIAGSGEVLVNNVSGPVDIRISGSGDVILKGGVADAFRVSIVGSGDVSFSGKAIDPSVSVLGAGDVWIKSYDGKLTKKGTGRVRVGN